MDLDFNMLIRSFAGIDSIMQSDGRVNRGGKLEKGIVKLAYLPNQIESTRRLKGIHDKKETTNLLLFGHEKK